MRLGLFLMVIIIPLIANAQFQAEAAINYTNVNYTNIYINQTYMDVIKSNKGETIPARDLDFGISISKTCYNIHKFAPVNSTSSCPTYEAIMALFPDTSYQDRSGEFIYKDGQLQRGRPQMVNHYNYYDFKGNQTFLFIDPDTETKKQLGMITIESSLPEYKINYPTDDNTRVMGEGRYIDNCRNAVIDGKNWVFLLGDTIEYLRHDCHPTYTLFQDNKTIYQTKTVHDITTSNKWLHDTWVALAKEQALFCMLSFC